MAALLLTQKPTSWCASLLPHVAPTMSVATASMVSPKAHAAMRHTHHLGLLQDSDLSTHHEGSRAFRSTCPLCHAILRSCRQAYTKFTHRARRFPSVHNASPHSRSASCRSQRGLHSTAHCTPMVLDERALLHRSFRTVLV